MGSGDAIWFTNVKQGDFTIFLVKSPLSTDEITCLNR